MKKFLSLLSVLTTSVTAVPTILAASPYKKQETKLDNIKQELSLNDYLEFNNKYIEKINSENINIDNIDNIGNVYFRKNEDIFVLKNDDKSTITKINGVNEKINVVLSDKNNNFYFGTDNGAFVLKNGETTTIKVNKINIRVNSIATDSKNNVYFGTDNGAFVLKNDKFTITKINEINNQIFTIKIDSKNNVYFGVNGGAFILKNDKLMPIKIIFETAVKKIIFDTFDNVYFASSYGAYIFKKDAINAIKINEIGEIYVNYIEIDNNNNIYFGADNGAFVLKNGETTVIKINGIDIDDPINLVLINNNDDVYLNGDKGIYLLKHNEINSHKVLELNNYINSIVIDNNNDVYFGTYYGAWILKNGETTATKINKIKGKVFFKKNIKNNFIYLENKNNLFILKNIKIKIKKIKNIINNTVYNYNFIYNVIFDKKNNVYFNTQNSVYFLEFGKIESIKIFVDEEYSIGNISIDNFDNFYIETSKSVYLYKNMEIKDLKIKEIPNIVLKQENILNKNLINYNQIEKITEKIYTSFTDKKNNIYFLTHTGFYIIKNGDVLPVLINGTEEFFQDHGLNNYVIVESKNNIYFTANTGFYFFKKNDETKINKIIGISDNISNILITNDNNMYITTWKNSGGTIYVLQQGETTATKIIEMPVKFSEIIVDNIGNLYFTTASSSDYYNSGGIYTIKNKLNFKSIIKVNNLWKIENNDDETILNNLNYLNRENNYFLNLNKMKIINKTSTSATIEAIKGKYRGQVTVNYKIKNKDEISNIDLNDLLQKAVYFDFIDKNFYSVDKINEIKNINIDNLNFGNIEVTRDSELLHSVDFKDTCFKKKTFTNISSKDTQKRKVPKCDYSTKSKLTFKIKTVLTKTNQENKLNGWNINLDDEIKLSDFININNKDSEIINTLSDNFDLSKTNKQEQEIILHSFNEDGYEISVDPKIKLEIKYSVREINLETILNLKQKITGNITAKIIDDNNEEQIITLSIKEAMQILQKYSLLSNEISINEDNSITFNGKAKITLTQESEPKLITKISNI